MRLIGDTNARLALALGFGFGLGLLIPFHRSAPLLLRLRSDLDLQRALLTNSSPFSRPSFSRMAQPVSIDWIESFSLSLGLARYCHVPSFRPAKPPPSSVLPSFFPSFLEGHTFFLFHFRRCPAFACHLVVRYHPSYRPLPFHFYFRCNLPHHHHHHPNATTSPPPFSSTFRI